MQCILVAIFIILTSQYALASEINAQDTVCEWYRMKKRGIGICHITDQGTIMDETTMTFHINDEKLSYTISDSGKATIGNRLNDSGWVNIWKGKVIRDDFKSIYDDGAFAVEYIKLSNGMKFYLWRY